MIFPELHFEDERCERAFSRLVMRHQRDGEVWRFVVTPAFTSAAYLISDAGRLLSLPRYRYYEANARSEVRHKKFLPGGIRKAGNQPSGHQTITITHDKSVFRTHVHRLVAWAFLGPQPPGHIIRHRDGNPSNNHVTNLTYCSSFKDGLSGRPASTEPAIQLTLPVSLIERLKSVFENREDPFSVIEALIHNIDLQRF